MKTQEEILNYNKKCAEFLGFKYRNHAKFWGIYPLDNNSYLRQLGYVRMDNLKFHSDWNWIMEMVEAVEELGAHVIMGCKIYGNFKINRYGVEFYFTSENKYLLHLELRPYLIDPVWKHPMFKEHIIEEFDFKNKSKKQAVVKAIELFLIWYESNK